MASLSEELKKKQFELNRLVDPNWAGGKYGAPGIGGEEVLAALLPAGIGMGGRALGAGVRGFNAAGKRLDPLAEGISGFVTSPSGQQFLGSWAKSALLGKLSKEIENRYGVGSQPWLRRELKGDEEVMARTRARGEEWDKKRKEILGDFLDSMPHHKEKSQKVVNIGMGDTIRNIRNQKAEERKRKEWALTILDQFQQQGASKKQIDDFIEQSGVAFNPDRESRVLHDAVLGAKEVEQYYPNPEGAEVKDLPMDNSIMNAVRTLRRERGIETAAPGLVEKDSQELFRKDPEKWLWSLGSEDVLGGQSIDPMMLTSALNAQGIDPHAFRRFHYLGVDDPDNPIVPDKVYRNYWSGLFDRELKDSLKDTGDDERDQIRKEIKKDFDYLMSQSDWKTRVIKGPLGKDLAPSAGQRAEWVKESNALIKGKESGQYPESLMKVFDEAIEKSRDIISGFDELFGYNAEEDKLKVESNLNDAEFQMLQDIRSKPEGQRLPYEKEELLRLESRSRWGKEFELWENWEYDK